MKRGHLFFAFILVLLTIASCHEHTWLPANCTTPKTCSECGETEGDISAREHDIVWETVAEPSCSSRGKKSGTCLRCGVKRVEYTDKLPHTPTGEWVIIEPATWKKGTRGQYCTVCGEIIEEESYSLSEEEIIAYLKDNCASYTYNEIARRPDDYIDKEAKFKGEVVQVIEDGNKLELRVNVTKKPYYWTDTIYVTFTKKESASRILENDIITVYGVLTGTITYETVLGNPLTIPSMRGIYIMY